MIDYLELPKSVTDVVESKIRNMIVSDDLHFGDQVSEISLASSFNISKTPVREALIRLGLQEGLVSVKPRSGYSIFRPTHKDIDDIGDLRVALEQGAIRFAMKRNRTKFLAALAHHADCKARNKLTPDLSDYRRLDFDFHGTFFQYADNKHLSEAYLKISTKVLAMRTRLNFTPEFVTNSLSGHASVATLLVEDRVDEACDLLEQHIRSGFTERAKMMLMR